MVLVVQCINALLELLCLHLVELARLFQLLLQLRDAELLLSVLLGYICSVLAEIRGELLHLLLKRCDLGNELCLLALELALLVLQFLLLRAEVRLELFLELRVLDRDLSLKGSLALIELAFEQDDVALELDDYLFFVDHDLGHLGLEVRDEPFLGLELGLHFLVGCAKLLVLRLNFVVELLDAAEVVYVALEIDLLLLSQGFFHQLQLVL